MKKQPHSIEVVFVFILFSIFAILSMLLIFIGSENYQSIIEAQDSNMNSRTGLSYISNKIHANDRKNAVSIDTIDGVSVLALQFQGDGTEYKNLIYCYDGAIREALTFPDMDFDLSYGEVLIPAQSLNMEYREEDNTVYIELIETDGSKKNVQIALRSGE